MMFDPGLWEWIRETLMDSDVHSSGGQLLCLPFSKCLGSLLPLHFCLPLCSYCSFGTLFPEQTLVSCLLLPTGKHKECKAWSCLTEPSLFRSKRHKPACEEEWGLVSRKRVLHPFCLLTWLHPTFSLSQAEALLTL